MRGIFIALALLLLPLALPAQTLTDAEREALAASLQRSDAQLVARVESVTPEQWTFKPAEDRWSIAEVAEHILISEQLFKQLINGPLMDNPRPEDMAAESRADTIRDFMLDRSQKFQAPAPAQPTGRWATQADFLDAWRAERRATLEWIQATDADLHGHVYENPVLGLLDGQEWMAFMAGHCERHLLQIEELMADPNFPPATSS